MIKLLEDDNEIQIIGTFVAGKDSEESLKEFLKAGPHIILSDMGSYLTVVPFLSDIITPGLEQEITVLLIGDSTLHMLADTQLKDLILKGVAGILPPSADSDLLKKAFKAIQEGEVWLDNETLVKIITAMKRPERKLFLAKREREIISHICQGYRNKEIAAKLNISVQTVKSHCSRIYKKLGVSDRLQLALCSQKVLHME
jgi:two-component system, NarL family, response regulator DegU